MKKFKFKKAILVFISLSIIACISIFSLQNFIFGANSGFVSANGTQFALNGNPYYFSGCNTYNLFTRGDGSNIATTDDIETKFMNKSQIDNLMQTMADDGVKVVRTWGFSHETWHGFEPKEGEYSEAQFMLFDYIMDSAKKHGLKVIIVLENYWEAYGGIDKRLEWEGLSGVSHSNRAKFFTNAGCKEQYRNYANHFVSRVNHYTNVAYKNDPTIFSWELMNEPRFQDAGENSTGTSLRAWVDEMASYIKNIDSNHMVSVGIEGHENKYGFGGNEGNPFIYIHQSPYIDFCTAHPYPDESWANLTSDKAAELVKAWITDSNTVGKPFVMEEFNTHANKSEYWTKMFKVIEENGGDGDLFWDYNDNRLSDFTMLHGDSELSNVFLPHAKIMEAKNNGTITATSNPTSTITSTSTTTVINTPTQTPVVTPTSTSTPASDGKNVVIYSQNDWGSGASVSITIKNKTSSDIDGWTLIFDFPGNQKITNLWSGEYTQNSTTVTIKNTTWNNKIPVNGSVSLGFNISYSGKSDKPTSITLNGNSCSIE